KNQDIIMALGAEMEEFGTKEAMADDQKVADVYVKKGAKVLDLDEAIVDKWRVIARDTAWKDYAEKTALSAELIKLGEDGYACRGAAGRRRSQMAAHGLEPVDGSVLITPSADAGVLARAWAWINYLVVIVSSIALVAASCVLTYSVVTRYFL